MSTSNPLEILKNHPTGAAETAANEAPTVLLSEETLAEIKARAGAATAGPWFDQITDEGYLRVTNDLSAVNGICGFGDMEGTDGQDHDNAEFIGHARADIPALLAHIEALQDRLNIVRDLLDDAEMERDMAAEYIRTLKAVQL